MSLDAWFGNLRLCVLFPSSGVEYMWKILLHPEIVAAVSDQSFRLNFVPAVNV